MNTRDMEEFALDGEDICYAALAYAGGGEKGLAYINANRIKKYQNQS